MPLISLFIVGSLVCWFFPLFHIRILDRNSTNEASVSRGQKPRTTSASQKLETYGTATDIAELWTAFDVDASRARRRYGRQAGLGGAWYFCVHGYGTVQTIEDDQVFLSISGSAQRVGLELGLVVGNTVREAIGVKPSDFANSQDFNAVSSELNHHIEHEVIAPRRALLEKGVKIEFVGCAKISSKANLDTLLLTPIRLKIHAANSDSSSQKTASAGAAL